MVSLLHGQEAPCHGLASLPLPVASKKLPITAILRAGIVVSRAMSDRPRSDSRCEPLAQTLPHSTLHPSDGVRGMQPTRPGARIVLIAERDRVVRDLESYALERAGFRV